MYVVLHFSSQIIRWRTDGEQQYTHCAKEYLVSTYGQQAVSLTASLFMHWQGIQYTIGSEWNCIKICGSCLSVTCLADSEWKCLYLNHR